MRPFARCLPLAALALAAGAMAQPALHEHGVAELLAVRQGPMLLLQMKGPAATFLGFERLPASEAERQVLRAGLKQLEAGRLLFRTPREAGCEMVSASVATPLLEALQPGADTAPATLEDHAGIFASYRFRCAEPERVDALEVRVFRFFTGTQEIRAETVGPSGGRTRSVLTAEAPRLPLPPPGDG